MEYPRNKKGSVPNLEQELIYELRSLRFGVKHIIMIPELEASELFESKVLTLETELLLSEEFENETTTEKLISRLEELLEELNKYATKDGESKLIPLISKLINKLATSKDSQDSSSSDRQDIIPSQEDVSASQEDVKSSKEDVSSHQEDVKPPKEDVKSSKEDVSSSCESDNESLDEEIEEPLHPLLVKLVHLITKFINEIKSLESKLTRLVIESESSLGKEYTDLIIQSLESKFESLLKALYWRESYLLKLSPEELESELALLREELEIKEIYPAENLELRKKIIKLISSLLKTAPKLDALVVRCSKRDYLHTRLYNRTIYKYHSELFLDPITEARARLINKLKSIKTKLVFRNELELLELEKSSAKNKFDIIPELKFNSLKTLRLFKEYEGYEGCEGFILLISELESAASVLELKKILSLINIKIKLLKTELENFKLKTNLIPIHADYIVGDFGLFFDSILREELISVLILLLRDSSSLLLILITVLMNSEEDISIYVSEHYLSSNNDIKAELVSKIIKILKSIKNDVMFYESILKSVIEMNIRSLKFKLNELINFAASLIDSKYSGKLLNNVSGEISGIIPDLIVLIAKLIIHSGPTLSLTLEHEILAKECLAVEYE